LYFVSVNVIDYIFCIAVHITCMFVFKLLSLHTYHLFIHVIAFLYISPMYSCYCLFIHVIASPYIPPVYSCYCPTIYYRTTFDSMILSDCPGHIAHLSMLLPDCPVYCTAYSLSTLLSVCVILCRDNRVSISSIFYCFSSKSLIKTW